MTRLLGFVVRRAVMALLLIVIVASAAMLLARLAPGDHLSGFESNATFVLAERQRLGLDRPVLTQYFDWVRALARLDFGESTTYAGRDVGGLIAERAGNSALVGVSALALATVVGIPLGVLTGSRRGGAALATARALTLLLLSLPPVVLSLALIFVAARTGWFPVGGLPQDRTLGETLRHLVLPVLALALPVAAGLECLQSRSMTDALADPAILAARGRGFSRRRIVWKHALRLSVRPVLAVYGIIIGALISGSFVVEYVLTWPGLGRLMYDGLVHRDANLVAGCAAAGAAFLAAGILVADLLLAAADPRLEAYG